MAAYARAGCELALTHETKPELASRVRRCWIDMPDRLAAVLDESGRDAVPRDVRAAGQRLGGVAKCVQVSVRRLAASASAGRLTTIFWKTAADQVTVLTTAVALRVEGMVPG